MTDTRGSAMPGLAAVPDFPGPDLLLQMYAGMVRVRAFEERVREPCAHGRIPGFLHTSVGQEAIAVGAAAALRPDDYVLSTQRGHGHLVAKGGALRGGACQ